MPRSSTYAIAPLPSQGPPSRAVAPYRASGFVRRPQADLRHVEASAALRKVKRTFVARLWGSSDIVDIEASWVLRQQCVRLLAAPASVESALQLEVDLVAAADIFASLQAAVAGIDAAILELIDVPQVRRLGLERCRRGALIQQSSVEYAVKLIDDWAWAVVANIANCHCEHVSRLKPNIARVRPNVLLTFYPLAFSQPYPACALRRNRVWEHAQS